LLIVNAITHEVFNSLVDLGQQLRHLRWLLLVAFRHRGCDNLPPGIHLDMQFPLAFVVLLAMLLRVVPFALATHLQSGTDRRSETSFSELMSIARALSSGDGEALFTPFWPLTLIAWLSEVLDMA